MRQIILRNKFPKGHPIQGQYTDFADKIFDTKIHACLKSSELNVGERVMLSVLLGNTLKGEFINIRTVRVTRKATVQIVTQFTVKDKKLVPQMFKVYVDDKVLTVAQVKELAQNEGLTVDDWYNWVGYNFKGYIYFFTDKKTSY